MFRVLNLVYFINQLFWSDNKKLLLLRRRHCERKKLYKYSYGWSFYVALDFERRDNLRKKRNELAVSLGPKGDWIWEREREKGQESRGWVQWKGGRGCYLTHQQVSCTRTKVFPIIHYPFFIFHSISSYAPKPKPKPKPNQPCVMPLHV